MKPTIILASGSPRRKELLATLNLPFEVRVSNADETVSEPVPPHRFVEQLAERKAHEVIRSIEASNALVIGSDTVVVLDGAILGKPESKSHAAEMLSKLQGRAHEVYTGLCIVRKSDMKSVSGYSKTEVHMRPLTAEQIERYIDTSEPMDKAGAYAIQGIGSTIVTEIHGDYFTVVGLPLYLLTDFLGYFGVNIL